jgi:phosphoglycerate dehydrogenase-like enzyme
MAAKEKFRVGITHDWAERTESVLGPALREVFGPFPDIEYEVMPECADFKPSLEVVDRYDALLVLGYYFDRELLSKTKRLKCLARWGVGYDRIDVEAATDCDIFVAVTPTTLKRTVSEGALTLLLTLSKNVLNQDRNVRAGNWRTGMEASGVLVRGRTVGVIGVGNIGSEFVRLAKAIDFGRVIAYDPFCTAERAAQIGAELADLDTLLRESDFISLHAPLTEQTRNIIDARALSLMKRSAYLINTARGELVDEDALLAALIERRIAGAALDVLRQEPPPKDHPFFALDNVILTPHWIPMTEENVEGNSREVCTNILAVFKGQIPPFIANPKVREKASMLAKIQR